MGQKLGGAVSFFLWESWVPIEHKVAWAEAYLYIKGRLSQSSRLATTDIDRKSGAVLLQGGGARFSSNTMWPRLKPTSIPSGILTHTAVWPQ